MHFLLLNISFSLRLIATNPVMKRKDNKYLLCLTRLPISETGESDIYSALPHVIICVSLFLSFRVTNAIQPKKKFSAFVCFRTFLSNGKYCSLEDHILWTDHVKFLQAPTVHRESKACSISYTKGWTEACCCLNWRECYCLVGSPQGWYLYVYRVCKFWKVYIRIRCLWKCLFAKCLLCLLMQFGDMFLGPTMLLTKLKLP